MSMFDHLGKHGSIRVPHLRLPLDELSLFRMDHLLTFEERPDDEGWRMLYVKNREGPIPDMDRVVNMPRCWEILCV